MTDWLCSGSDVINKAGIHVKSTLSGSSVVANFILQSQGYVDTTTNKTWLTDYASLPGDAKEILRDVVSSHAALKCIMFDSTGYLSRESDTLLNVNDEIVSKGLQILKDFKSISLRSAV